MTEQGAIGAPGPRVAVVRLSASGTAAVVRAGDPTIAQARDLAEAFRAAGRTAILIVPGLDARLARLSLPPRNRSAFLSALPFAVEDRVAGPAESIAVAAAAPERDGTLVVAVASRTLLDGWRRSAAEAGTRLRAVLAEPLCLPASPTGWTVLFADGVATVRCDPALGFACDADSLAELLRRRLDEAGGGAPPALTVYGSGPVPVAWPSTRHPCRDPLALLWPQCRPVPAPDLLTAVTNADDGVGRRTLAASLAGLAAAAAGVAILGALEAADFTHRVAAARQEAIGIFRRALPDQTAILDPRRQMQLRLDQVRQGRTDAERLAAIVLALDAALAADPGLRVRSIVLDGDGYRLVMSKPAPDLARRLGGAVEPGGSSVRVAR